MGIFDYRYLCLLTPIIVQRSAWIYNKRFAILCRIGASGIAFLDQESKNLDVWKVR